MWTLFPYTTLFRSVDTVVDHSLDQTELLEKNNVQSPIEVDPVNHYLDQEVSLNDVIDFQPLEINSKPEDNEITFDGMQQELDVEPDTFIEKEFEDTDKIDLDAPKQKKPLDINLSGGLTLND
jgi:hypothetical protein